MKMRFLILLLIVPIMSCVAQAHHKKGERVGPDGVVLVDSVVNKNGQIYTYSGGSLIGVYNDSILILSAELQTATSIITTTNTSVRILESSTAGSQGYGFSFSGDTMVVEFEGEIMKFTKASGIAVDITAPTITAVEIGGYADDTVIVTFSEAMDTDSIAAMSSFTFTEDGTTYGLAQAYFNNDDSLYIPLDSVAETGKVYFLSYVKPGVSKLQDVSNNDLVGFSNQTVVSNLACESEALAHFKFENNDDDERSNVTLVWNGAEDYGADFSNPEGSYNARMLAGPNMYSNASVDLGDGTTGFTVAGWFYGGEGAKRVIFAGPEWEVWIDYISDEIEASAGGNSVTTAGLSGLDYDWMHIAAVFTGGGYCKLYKDGVNYSSDSITANSFNANGVLHIGADFTGNNEGFSHGDDVQIYDVACTAANIFTIYDTPGTTVTVDDCGDPPTPDDSINIYWEEDFEDFPIQNTVSASTFAAYLTDYESLGSEADGISHNIDIIEFEGSRVMESNYYENQCCYTICPIANGGTGTDVRAEIGTPQEHHVELYFTYEIFPSVGFDNPQGIKCPGLQMDKQGRSARIMLNNKPGENLAIQFYYSGYFDGYDNPSYLAPSTVYGSGITAGQWNEITYRLYAGTEAAWPGDGLFEIFVNGVFINHGRYGIPFRKTGDPNGWSYIPISTFMGGCGEQYFSPQNQSILYDNLRIWMYKDGVDVPRNNTPSGSNRRIYPPD